MTVEWRCRNHWRALRFAEERGWTVMTWFLLDSGLLKQEGHHDHFAKGFCREARRRNWPGMVLSHKNVDQALRDELGAVPTFSESLYSRYEGDPYDAGLHRFATIQRCFSHDLNALDIAVSEGDLMLIPTATPAEVAGLGAWLKARKLHPRVAGIFHWGDEKSLAPGSLESAMMRMASRSVADAGPRDVWWAATHSSLCRSVSQIMEMTTILEPSLTFFEPLQVWEPGRRDRLNVGIFGGGRAAKGIERVPILIESALSRNERISFTIHAHGLCNDLRSTFSTLSLSNDVKFVGDWLDEHAFLDLLCSVDVVLMPYDERTYSSMVSGIFTLAAGYGKPSLVPAATWMADRIAAGEASGVEFNGASLSSIVNSICLAKRHIARLEVEARDRAAAWRNRYSAAALVSRLSRWARAGASASQLAFDPTLAQSR